MSPNLPVTGAAILGVVVVVVILLVAGGILLYIRKRRMSDSGMRIEGAEHLADTADGAGDDHNQWSQADEDSTSDGTADFLNAGDGEDGGAGRGYTVDSGQDDGGAGVAGGPAAEGDDASGDHRD